MSYFIHSNNEEFANQLDKFATELPNYATALGFTAAEQTSAVNDAAYMKWCVKTEGIYKDYADGFTTFLYTARHSKVGSTLAAPPVPVIDTMPTAVLPGIQSRFAQRAKKAKASSSYTDTIGQALGIVGAATASRGADADTPDLKVVLNAGYPTLSFHLLGYEAINIYKDAGSGYVLFKTAHRSPVQDTALPAADVTANYKYKAIYVDHDTEVATMSGEISVAVVGR